MEQRFYLVGAHDLMDSTSCRHRKGGGFRVGQKVQSQPTKLHIDQVIGRLSFVTEKMLGIFRGPHRQYLTIIRQKASYQGAFFRCLFALPSVKKMSRKNAPLLHGYG